MIEKLRLFIFSPGFIFGLIVFGFLAILVFLLLENHKDNKQIKLLNQKVQDLIQGDYSEVLDVLGSPELTDMTNSLNDLSEVIRLTQDSLEQEKNRLSSILTYMSDGVMATDRQGRIILINETAKRQLGLLDQTVMGEMFLVDVLDIAEDYSFSDLLKNTPELFVDLPGQTGEYMTFRANIASIKRESGFTAGLVVVLHDMTKQIKEERERRLFVSTVSHELRTPLTSVKSYLEALHEGALTDAVAPSFVKVSLDETNRMMRMITDLLNLSRFDNQTIELELELVNFTAFMTFILNRFDQMKQQEDRKHYTIIRNYPIKPIWIEIDTDKISQVIDNIVNNAIKYSPDGGNITISMKTTENQLIISIADEGLGIPKSDLSKIFDRFYRVDKARSRAQGGTGLGLAIAKEIIKAHQGFIWAKSDYGKGSTFTMVLPYDKLVSEDWEDTEVLDKLEMTETDAGI
ncbi:cell wall metabolism sensor histidine kinase VicK [Streptococcus ovuberis]|uniref:histidine kinase n=1 Tax=Streptococcus ovuberis TaxID=1936207 RepID=A0A7X6MZN9_9STRE|nr:cell wall metabolism sensor histidine kinase VicK [Streptococcus ovuberis]NKZ19344.1 cell wall metabolism sensor histidine kinase VicK [Streptococcus ovuberis]